MSTSPWAPDPNRPKQPPAFSDWVRFWRELGPAGRVLLGLFPPLIIIALVVRILL